MYQSIATYDWQAVLALLQSLSWMALVCGVIYLLLSLKSASKTQRKTLLVLLFTWMIAYTTLAGINIYSYFDVRRDELKQSIEIQTQQ